MQRTFLTGAFLATLFLFVSGAAGASVEELQAQLHGLRAAALSLQAELVAAKGSTAAAAAPAGSAFCYNWTRNLREGDRGRDVDALVKAMAEEKLIRGTPGEKISGRIFDRELALAVSLFQERYAKDILAPNKLSRGTGFAGVATRAKLNELYGCRADTASAPAAASPAAPASSASSTKPSVAASSSIAAAPTIRLLSPNGGERFAAGERITMRWATSRWPEETIRASIQDGNGAEVFLLGSLIRNTGAGVIDLPATLKAGSYTLKIGCSGCTANATSTDVSDASFTVTAPATPVITVLAPKGGEQYFAKGAAASRTVSVPVSWSVNYDPTAVFSVFFTDPDGNQFSSLTGWGAEYAVAGRARTYSLTLTTSSIVGLSRNQFKAKVCSNQNGIQICDSSDSFFTVAASSTPPSVSAAYPSSVSANQTVAVYGGGFKTGASVLFDQPKGTSLSGVVSSDGTRLTFTIPSQFLAGKYMVFVKNADGAVSAQAVSFTVTARVAVLSPNGGERFTAGQKLEISWSTTLTDAQGNGIALSLYSPQGYVQDIVRGLKKTSSFDWTIPSNLSGSYKIYIAAEDAPGVNPAEVNDWSDNYFVISAPTSWRENVELFAGVLQGARALFEALRPFSKP